MIVRYRPLVDPSDNLAQFDGATGILLKAGLAVSTDGTLADDSDTVVATQKAVKAYADALPMTLPAVDLKSVGPVTSVILAGATITALDLVVLATSGKLVKTAANATGTSVGFLAISLESKADTEAMKVALPGSFVRKDAWAWTPNDALYVSETTGEITATPPATSGAVIRAIGYAVTADVIYFQPSPDYTTHA